MNYHFNNLKYLQIQAANNKKDNKIKRLISLIINYLQPTRTQESTQEKIKNFIKHLEKKYIINN